MKKMIARSRNGPSSALSLHSVILSGGVLGHLSSAGTSGISISA